jgi:ABC-2 type transport system ATP-binding protein
MGSGSASLPTERAPPASGRGVECRSVRSGYLGSEVLHDVSFSVDEPAVYVVLGPNGAGKTTLFRTLAGILRPYSGEVRIEGVPLDQPGSRGRLHYLSHVDGMPEGLTVRRAIELYARVEGASTADVERVLDLLEIRELSDRFLAQLSSGQRKRASIARIFLRERAIYLLDEPTANLDPKVAREIRTLVLDLAREKVVLYSSHNLFEAREIGRYVLAIKEGRVQHFGRIDEMRGGRYVVGIRTLAPSDALAGWAREGDYYTRELAGPEEVPKLLAELESRGVQVREVREMTNPLEDLFR